MQQFLRTQEAVTAAYARRKRVGEVNTNGSSLRCSRRQFLARSSVRLSAKPWSPQRDESPTILRTQLFMTRQTVDLLPTIRLPPLQLKVELSSNTRKLPFIETILELTPGERLTAEFELTIAKHPFLGRPHVFRSLGFEWRLDTRLPVMPMVMTLELMAEGAITLFPDVTASECEVAQRVGSHARASRGGFESKLKRR